VFYAVKCIEILVLKMDENAVSDRDSLGVGLGKDSERRQKIEQPLRNHNFVYATAVVYLNYSD